MARPKKQITPEILVKVKEFASRGLSKEQIAHNIDQHPATLYAKQKDHPELVEAMQRGKSAGIYQLSNKLFEEAMEGNTAAAIYMLKCLDPQHWNERRHAEPPVPLVDLERYTEEEIQQIALNGLKQMLHYEKKRGLPPRAQQLILEYEEGLKLKPS